MVQERPTQSEPFQATDDEAAIRSVMASYNDALNSGSTDAALRLCAEDGVFMPPYSQSAVGKGSGPEGL
jgi:ketosteroid isomerase-like protein